MTSTTETRIRGGIGESVRRPDGIPKLKGDFAYASDLQSEGLLWGATRRSPHPHARIVSIDTSAAAAAPGVEVVVTGADFPYLFGSATKDQPFLAIDRVRYVGEPVAAIAAQTEAQAQEAVEAHAVPREGGVGEGAQVGEGGGAVGRHQPDQKGQVRGDRQRQPRPAREAREEVPRAHFRNRRRSTKPARMIP